jgi:hypothetical protein
LGVAIVEVRLLHYKFLTPRNYKYIVLYVYKSIMSYHNK